VSIVPDAPPGGGPVRSHAAARPEYRMYVDEVGHSALKSSDHPDHRHLSLTGVIVQLDYAASTLRPAIEDLKSRYFNSHPDEPVILHRKEMVNARPPFEALKDVGTKAAFDHDLLGLLGDLDYVVITAVIDKAAHHARYQARSDDPYHYCMEILVERYVLWLLAKGARGDVMAESRGGPEDRRLKAVYSTIHERGNGVVDLRHFRERLTSRELKVKPKHDNVTGLQLADMIAHPSFKAMLAMRLGRPLDATFGGQVGEILERSKYRRLGTRIEGIGRKWLP